MAGTLTAVKRVEGEEKVQTTNWLDQAAKAVVARPAGLTIEH
jgi:hypothetical protein